MSGRLAKWDIELSGYDIKFVPAKAIKAQVLAYFIAELSPEAKIEEKTDEIWTMKVDRSVEKASCGVGIVLKNTEGLQLEHAIHFNFQTTNNVAGYEALLAGLDLAKELGIRTLEIYTDSQLVANQIDGIDETKDQSLKDHKEIETNTIKEFRYVKINLIKKECIEEADALAKLDATKNTKEDKWVQVRALPHSFLQKIQENLEITTSTDDWRTVHKRNGNWNISFTHVYINRRW